MHTFLWAASAAIVGIALGFIFRSLIAKAELATINELKSWRQRLDSAATAEIGIAKREMQAVAAEIKAKL